MLFRILLLLTMLLAAQQVPLPGGLDVSFLLPYVGALALCAGVASGVRIPRRITLPPQLLLAAALVMTSALVSPVPWITLPAVVQDVLLSTEFLWAIGVLLLLVLLRPHHTHAYLLLTVALLSVQQITMGIYQFVLLRADIWGSFRAPSLIARFVLVTWPFLAAALATYQRAIFRFAIGLLIAGLCTVLVLSSSRIAIVAFIVQVAYMVSRARKRYALMVALFLGIVLLSSNHWGSWVRPEDTQRLFGWETAMDISLKYPLFGIGPGTFSSYYAAVPHPQATELLANTHSLWLHLASEFGVLSLPLLFWIVLSCWRALVRREQSCKNRMDGVFFWAARAVMIGLAMQSLVEY